MNIDMRLNTLITEQLPTSSSLLLMLLREPVFRRESQEKKPQSHPQDQVLSFRLQPGADEVIDIMCKHPCGAGGNHSGYILCAVHADTVFLNNSSRFCNLAVAFLSMATSTMAEPGFIAFTISSVTNTGASLPGISAVDDYVSFNTVSCGFAL